MSALTRAEKVDLAVLGACGDGPPCSVDLVLWRFAISFPGEPVPTREEAAEGLVRAVTNERIDLVDPPEWVAEAVEAARSKARAERN